MRKRRAKQLPAMREARARGDYAIIGYDRLIVRPRKGKCKGHDRFQSDMPMHHESSHFKSSTTLEGSLACSFECIKSELCSLAELNDIHIFAVSETHLDSSFNYSELIEDSTMVSSPV